MDESQKKIEIDPMLYVKQVAAQRDNALNEAAQLAAALEMYQQENLHLRKQLEKLEKEGDLGEDSEGEPV